MTFEQFHYYSHLWVTVFILVVTLFGVGKTIITRKEYVYPHWLGVANGIASVYAIVLLWMALPMIAQVYGL